MNSPILAKLRLSRYIYPRVRTYKWVSVTQFPKGDFKSNRLRHRESSDHNEEAEETQEQRRNSKLPIIDQSKQFYNIYHEISVLKRHKNHQKKEEEDDDFPFRRPIGNFVPHFEEHCYYLKLGAQKQQLEDVQSLAEQYKNMYLRSEEE